MEARAELGTFPPVTHPPVRPHPVTGEEALHLNEMCLMRSEGLLEGKSQAVTKELYSHTVKTEGRYVHRWRPGDLLGRDNPSVLHRAEGMPPGMHRLAHRATGRYPGHPAGRSR